MSKLFIEDSTLIAIADAIRSKVGGVPVVEPLKVIVHTPNTYGFSANEYDSSIAVIDKSVGKVINGYDWNYYEFQIPGATKLAITMSYWLNYTGSGSTAAIKLYSGWMQTESNASLQKERSKNNATANYEYEITNSEGKATICVQTNDPNYTGYGFYAEIVGYDADGNIITTEGATYGGKTTYTPLQMPSAILSISGEGGGGITPVGEIEILENGDYDVTTYASAHVEVPVGVFPEGILKVTTVGYHNCYNYDTVNVAVPLPSGTLNVTENGTHNVWDYEFVNVNVAGEGGGASIPDGSITLLEDCTYACSGPIAAALLENFPKAVGYAAATNMMYMFKDSTLEVIPFAIEGYGLYNSTNMTNAFKNCRNLIEAPSMPNMMPSAMNGLFDGCWNLNNVDAFGTTPIYRWTQIHSNSDWQNNSQVFYDCYSLRRIPSVFLNEFYSNASYGVYSTYHQGFFNCRNLDEIDGLGVYTGTQSDNYFNDTFTGCGALKKMTFAVNADGTAKTAAWSNQVIDLSAIGFLQVYDASIRINQLRNSGRVESDIIYNAATYEANKNNPNSIVIGTADEAPWLWSRYDKASAVETINSLPDCSASGANHIKFKGAAGTNTTEGAINTMTDAQIAVAAAKGWTVTFV